MHEARMLLRWLLLGVIIAAAVRTFVPHETFAEWFGPTLFGLGMTLIATTVLRSLLRRLRPRRRRHHDPRRRAR
jgi:uncharacterized membrane protein YraQ (UPF0718 family)